MIFLVIGNMKKTFWHYGQKYCIWNDEISVIDIVSYWQFVCPSLDSRYHFLNTFFTDPYHSTKKAEHLKKTLLLSK